MTFKSAVTETVRRTHLIFSPKTYPDRIAVMFHELLERQWPAFRVSITALREAGFQVVSPKEYCEPDLEYQRRLLVTFDDNFQQWHRALPLLDELGLKCTFYVNSGPFHDVADPARIENYFERIKHREDPIPLTRRELRDIRKAGHVIGCHSHWHRNLARLPRSDWAQEIEGSRDALEDVLGEPVSDFSYPFGMRRHFSEQLRDYCKGIGFETIAEGRPGRLYASEFDPFAIQRTRWNIDLSLKRNLNDLRVDGRLFEEITGRSAIG